MLGLVEELHEGPVTDRMTDYELLRIINFLERIRAPYDEKLNAATPDPVWNIVLYLMKSHLRGDTVTMSSLASVSQIPFPSAMRRIHRLIDDGDVEQMSRSPTGKSYFLVPSRKLKSNFVAYAIRVKALLAETFGLGGGSANAEEYYFGGSYLADQIIPPLKLMENRQAPSQDLRFLLHDDNYFSSMRNMWSDFRSKLSSRRNFRLLALPELHKEIFKNARRPASEYDVMAVNIPWLGEVVKHGLVQPLNSFLVDSGINSLDFHPNIWATGNWDTVQYGVPIYCTIETLAVRKDLFETHDLHMPTSFEKVLDAARQLHNPKRGMHGIVWNAARGMPIAHSFMFFMGACGTPVINVPMARVAFDYSHMAGEMYRPRVNTEQGMKTLDYMRRLLAFSPPDILVMDWNRALDCFMLGQSAMIYCWTMRASRFEYDIRSVVKRKVEYLPHPHGPGGAVVGPVGGFLLTIPAGLPPERTKLAFEAISWMASPAAMKEHVKNGIPVAPRFSVTADPEAAATTPIVRMVDRLAKQNKLHGWHRPPIPEYTLIEKIIGDEIFAALNGELTDREALERCQNGIDKVMRAAGHY
ncbi:extracellular solute-binding protein [Mesorhizobium sp. YC-39]|uniref:extracellular solute-binding protein n=1 Tax=unclassified Mesorhizobium TaxID=325217 RepID=UPI0021E75BC6|nr:MULTISPECIES: extracellular solute-binding protein [unclassified Mesorhizobium]MCV3206616.1 extracellular solute-binding protein [Mesorhizobium sp. YC-2]MCV3226984.1 extracellular solute-binding protein [Mesorhizobium sp. YC-39]